MTPPPPGAPPPVPRPLRLAENRLLRLGPPAVEERIGLAEVLALPVGQRVLAVAFPALLFVKEDGQRAHQSEIVRRGGLAYLAAG